MIIQSGYGIATFKMITDKYKIYMYLISALWGYGRLLVLIARLTSNSAFRERIIEVCTITNTSHSKNKD